MARQNGTSSRYIEAGSTDPKVTQWFSFVTELDTVYGDPGRIRRASDKKMKEISRVHRYTVLFKESADELGWPYSVLHQLYYNDLPNRIKSDPNRVPPSMIPFLRHSGPTTATGNVSMKRRNSTPLKHVPLISRSRLPNYRQARNNPIHLHLETPFYSPTSKLASSSSSSSSKPADTSRSSSTPTSSFTKDLSNILFSPPSLLHSTLHRTFPYPIPTLFRSPCHHFLMLPPRGLPKKDLPLPEIAIALVACLLGGIGTVTMFCTSVSMCRA